MGFRFSGPQNPNALISGTPLLRIGFCNGDTVASDVPPASAAHAIYYVTNDTSWAEAGGSPRIALDSTSGLTGQFEKVNGGSVTAIDGTDSANSLIMAIHDGTEDNWTQYAFIELEKIAKTGDLGTSFMMRWGGGDSSAAHKDHTDLILEMEEPTFASIADVDVTTLDANTSTSEVDDGEFDAVFFSWDETQVPFRIHDIIIAVIEAP